MKVKDIMHRKVDYVTVNSSVRDISKLIFGRGIVGIPVLKNKKVVGFITARDILSQFLPSIAQHFEDPVNTSNFAKLEEKIANTKEVFNKKAKDIMNKNITTVKPEDHVLKAHSLMSLKKISRLPVIDENKKMIGIVTKNGVFRAYIGTRLELEENEEFNDFLSLHYPFIFNWEKRLSKEIPSIISILKKKKAKRILDIGAGIGSHSIELSKKGYTAYAFERSSFMVKIARENIKSLPTENVKNIKLISNEYLQGLKDLNYEKFDAAIFMGNSLAHNPQKFRQIVRETMRHLSTDGVLIFQIRNFEKYLKHSNRIAETIFFKGIKDFEEHLMLEFFDPPKNRRINHTISIFDSDGNTWSHYGTRTTKIAYITQSKIETLLKSVGAKNIRMFGSNHNYRNWEKLFTKPFEVSKSDWLNIVAEF